MKNIPLLLSPWEWPLIPSTEPGSNQFGHELKDSSPISVNFFREWWMRLKETKHSKKII